MLITRILNKVSFFYNYYHSKHLKTIKYEKYLINRYRKIMNKKDYTRGKTLNFENLQTFSEKSQWIKLYDQDPRKPLYSDKYLVRNYIENVLGKEYLFPLIEIDGKNCFNDAFEIYFDETIKIVSKLCSDFVYVRVDLYNIRGRIFVGELAFNSAAGYDVPFPVEFDRIIGDYMQIDKTIREKYKGIYYAK